MSNENTSDVDGPVGPMTRASWEEVRAEWEAESPQSTHPIQTRAWWEATGLRAIKTFAQAIVAMIGVGLVAWAEVPWVLVLSTALVSAMVSVLMSIVDLPDGTGRWWKIAAVRAVRTFAQVLAGAIGTGLVAWGDVQWALALSTAAVATVLSLATTIAGLPEVADLDYQPRH